MQVDNYQTRSLYPVVLAPIRQPKPFVQFVLQQKKLSPPTSRARIDEKRFPAVLVFPMLCAEVLRFKVQLEEELVWEGLSFLNDALVSFKAIGPNKPLDVSGTWTSNFFIT